MTISDLKRKLPQVTLLPFGEVNKLWDDLSPGEKRAAQRVAKDAPEYTGFFVVKNKTGYEKIYAFDGASPYPWRQVVEVRANGGIKVGK